MDDTTQVEWSFVGIESPYCQGRHSTERTTIYAYNSRPLPCVTTEYATLLTALAKPCIQFPFPMRDVDAISSLGRNTVKHNMSHTLCQASIRLYSTCSKNDFVTFAHKEPPADSDFRTDMTKHHLNRGTKFKGNQTFSSIPQYTDMSEDGVWHPSVEYSNGSGYCCHFRLVAEM